MSRSRKKNAYTGHTCAGSSEKWDKRKANRRLRHKCNILINSKEEDIIFPEMRDVSDIWGFIKDGKSRYEKNDEWYKKVIRK